jgi:chromosome partitioning protein
VPAKVALAKLEANLVGQFDAPFRLKDALAAVRDEFDLIVIDTPPALGIITVNALVAANYLLVPIQASYYSLEGTDDLLETLERIRARPNPELQLLGVIVTLYDKRTNLARDIYKQVREVFGDKVFNTVICKNVRLEESPAYKETIFSFAPDSSGAAEYAQLAREVIQRVS